MVSIRGYLKKNLRSNIELQCCEVEFTFKNLEMFKNYGNERNILYELAVFGKEMLYFFRKCLNLYEEYKTENGFLDYEDILFKTYNILQNSNTREFLTEKYTYLMIDEYQDTNEIQYYIFLPLLDNLKKGNLFVVGDEKQSIYMFREAEPEVFQRTKVDISKISGQESILNLPDSFRMKPELCLFINEMFRKLFNNPDPLFNEVAPSDLICALKEDDPGKIEILFYNKDSKDENSESELVVKRIIKLISEGNGKYKWGDVAILCRKRKSFPELEKKLAEFNIPFLIMGGKEFYQRQSVYDIYNYFSFLLDNDNDTALVGLLRSPFFSFSDNDIYQISLEEGKSFWQKLKAFRRKYTKGEKTYNVLKENIHLVMDIDITLLMRKIFKESPFISVIAARPDGLQETANIEKLITLTTTFMREGYKTLYDYVNFIKVSIEEKDDEPQASLSENSETIKIMTLHQAKGLEFSIIVLYKCNEVTPINIVKTKSVIADKKLGLLTKIPIKENYYSLYQSSTINEISNFILGKKEFAEAKRLFYVGVTRVREQLIISFESNNELKLNYGSFIHMLKNALNVDLNQDTIKVEGDLTFLEDKNGICENNEKNLFLEIPIIKSFHLAASIVKDPDSIKEKKLEIASLLDEVSNEIISATKFSIFSQCPLRYYYQYELGFTSVNKGFIDIGREKISEKYRKDGSLKGRIIHSLLEEKFTGEDIYDKVKIKLENENIAITEKTNLINDIAEDLNNYYNSKTFKDIISAEYYQNEYELYIRENDFYLHGILDKVIFSDNRIKIIDYKTEVISPSEIESRREQYLSQLKFYAYIISRFFADIQSFELQIIFIKNPDIKVQFRLNKQDIISIKDEIVKMMESLKAWTFIKNMDFCSKCGYSFDKLKCIKEK
jgi:ATP-dependent helicase/nuclease subunit A